MPTLTIPDYIPESQRSYWKRVANATFMKYGSPIKAKRVADNALEIKGSAVKAISPSQVPSFVPASKQLQWRNAYSSAIKSGSTIDDANEIAAQTISNFAKVKVDLIDPIVKIDRMLNEGAAKHSGGGAIKASSIGEGWVEGYGVSWGNSRDTDLQGEWFTPGTNFCLDWFNARPLLYHHALDQTVGLKTIGVIPTIKQDDLGLWIAAQLDLRDKYARAVYDMVKATQFGFSSGSVDHLVKIAPTGEIKTWPLIEVSITPSPAQASKVTVRALKSFFRGEFLNDSSRLRELYAEADDNNVSFSEDDSTVFGGTIMATKSSVGHIKKAAKDLGVKLSPSEIATMADELDEATMSDFDESEGLMDDDFDPSAMDDDFDPSVMDDDFDPSVMDDDFDPATFDDDFDPSAMDDEFDPAAMSDEFDDAAMDDEFDDTAVMSAKSRRIKAAKKAAAKKAAAKKARTKSVGVGLSDDFETQYWKSRAMKAELREYPGQRNRSLGGFGKITDEADKKGAYDAAFKSYIFKGELRINERERYTLDAKGKRYDNGATMEFDNLGRSVKTYNISSDASWGYAVPENWINELNKNVMTRAQMAQECRTVMSTSDSVVQPNLLTNDARRAHAANVSWPGESPANAAETAATEDTLSQIRIPIHVMMLNHTATLSALEDSAFDLEGNINEAFAEAVSVAYESLIWSGNGQGKLMGIVNDPTVNAIPSTGIATVGGYLATGSVNGFLNADVIKRMAWQLPTGWRAKAKWYMNSNTAAEISTLKDGMGNYLINDRNEGLQTMGYADRLLRYPIVINEWASDINSGAFPVVLGDLSQAYTIAKRIEFTIRRFDDSAYAIRDQVLFLGRARIGGQVTQPAAMKLLKIATS